MKGWEMMVVNMLKGMGFDPDAIMKDVNAKVQNFEAGMKALNDNLTALSELEEQNNKMLRALCEAQNIAIPPVSNVTYLPPQERSA